MKKIGIVASTRIEFYSFIYDNLKHEITQFEMKENYHRIDPEIKETVLGCRFSKILFANKKYENMYWFFKSMDSRVFKD